MMIVYFKIIYPLFSNSSGFNFSISTPRTIIMYFIAQYNFTGLLNRYFKIPSNYYTVVFSDKQFQGIVLAKQTFLKRYFIKVFLYFVFFDVVNFSSFHRIINHIQTMHFERMSMIKTINIYYKTINTILNNIFIFLLCSFFKHIPKRINPITTNTCLDNRIIKHTISINKTYYFIL